jgi:type IV pilus assembly protein PilM
MALSLGSKKLLAIDWDKRNLRMALVRVRADDIELLKAVSVPIPEDVAGDDAESLGAFIREALRQSRLSVKSAILAIPREQVVLNMMDLPPTPEEEMASLVHFQIVKELPFAPDQATIDFVVCDEHDPKTRCTALVAAVRNEELAFYRKMAHEAGLSVERIGLRPHANLTAVLACLADRRDESTLVVEVGPLLTEIDIIQSGALTFSRAASVSLPDFGRARAVEALDSRVTGVHIQDVDPEDEAGREAVRRLVVDVSRSFEAHRATDPSVKIDRIVVCGATGVEQQLAESLAGRFAAPAQLFSPDRAFGLTPQRAKELRGFNAVLGLARGQLLEGLNSFDFLHPKKPVSRRSRRIKRAPVAVLTAVLLVAAAVTFRIRFIGPEQDKVQGLQAVIRKDQKREKPIKEFAQRVEALEDWKASEQRWPEVLAALTEVFPPAEEAFVTRLDFETRAKRKSTLRSSTLKLKLRTAKLGAVSQQSAALRDLGFENVVAGQETRIGIVRPGDVYRFDSSVSAEIPLRPKTKTEPQNVDEADEADQADPEETVSPSDPAETAIKPNAAQDGGASQ